MVTPDLLIEFYQERADDALAHIRYLALDTGEMSRIRETFPGDWEVEELTRHILFLDNQISESLMEDIEHDRKAVREHEKRRSLESVGGV